MEVCELKNPEDFTTYYEKYNNHFESRRTRLLLYQFINDCDSAVYAAKSGACLGKAPTIKAGTIQIGVDVFGLWSTKWRRNPSDEFKDGGKLVEKYDRMYDYNAPPIYARFRPYYQILPGEPNFTRVYGSNLEVDVIVMGDENDRRKDVRLFDIGDFGIEITATVPPEQVAQKYFGTPDFSKLFSYLNRADFNKHRSLQNASRAYQELRGELANMYCNVEETKGPSLTGTHYPEKSEVEPLIPKSERNKLIKTSSLSRELMRRMSTDPKQFLMLHTRVNKGGRTKKAKIHKTRRNRTAHIKNKRRKP